MLRERFLKLINQNSLYTQRHLSSQNKLINNKTNTEIKIN